MKKNTKKFSKKLAQTEIQIFKIAEKCPSKKMHFFKGQLEGAGEMPSGVYIRTKPPWNKGLTKEMDDRILQASKKISKTLTGRKHSEAARVKQSLSVTGPNNPAWKPELHIRKPCACGCRELASPGKRFISEHNLFRKNKTYEEIYGLERAIEERKKRSHSSTLRKGHPNPNIKGRGNGGIREDLGHFVRSSWEADFARFLNWFGVKYEYEKYRFDLGTETYCPDFYLKDLDLFIEIRGWMDEGSEKQLETFREKFPEKRLVVYGEKEKSSTDLVDCDYYKFRDRYKSLVPNWEN